MQFSIQQPFFTSMLPLNPLHFPMNSTISTRVRRDLQISVSIPQNHASIPKRNLRTRKPYQSISCERIWLLRRAHCSDEKFWRKPQTQRPFTLQVCIDYLSFFYVLKTSSDSRIIHPPPASWALKEIIDGKVQFSL